MTFGTDNIIRGLTFSEFQVGLELVTARRTITEADITGFAGLSGDFNPVHTDEPHAARTIFRGRIAHGLLVQSIASGLANQLGVFHHTLTALQSMKMEFRSPVRAGDTIEMHLRVLEVDPEPGPKRGWVRFKTEVHDQDGRVAIAGEWVTIINRR